MEALHTIGKWPAMDISICVWSVFNYIISCANDYVIPQNGGHFGVQSCYRNVWESKQKYLLVDNVSRLN